MDIILASSSPRRKIILQNLLNLSKIISPEIEETALPEESPQHFSERISDEKARSIIQFISNSSPVLIISCDTIVTINDRIIGKPVDFEDAINIINALNGKTHEVISSITLLYLRNGKIFKKTTSEITNVTFKKITNSEIISYLKRIDYKDKAGAYAIQESGNSIIKTIKGSTTNVIGFPLRLFFKMVVEMNLFYDIFF